MTEPPPEKREEIVWRDIDRAFSTPLTMTDNSSEYIPTQILAELFKSAGYDGIGYRSSLGPGHNIALFDFDSAKLISGHVYSVKNVTFQFEEANHSYSVPDDSK